MPSRRRIIVSTGIVALVSLAAHLPAFAVPTDDDFTQAKQGYDEVWNSALDANQKRAALERDLEKYQSRLEQVRTDLEKAGKERREVRIQIAEKRRLMEAIAQQIAAVEQSRSRYTSLSQQQRGEFVEFLRYVAAKQMEVSDTGPVQGGTLTRRVLRGSLGDAIEQELGRQALLTARQTLISQLATLATESDKAAARLQEVSTQLSAELTVLTDQYSTLAKTEAEKATALDDSWKAQQLTTQQLDEVKNEADEANQKVVEMQQSLLSIHKELKENRGKQLQQEKDDLTAEQKTEEKRKQELGVQIDALNKLNDTQLRAYNDAYAARNSDKRQYKRVEVAELAIAARQADLAQTQDDAAKSAMESDIEALQEKLALLKDGIPEESAIAYLGAKHAWDAAEPKIPPLKGEIDGLSIQLADLTEKLGRVAADIDANEKDPGVFDTIQPIFTWPVVGPVTAGYHDVDYQRVFGIPHQAIDIAVPQSSPVYSVADGVVYAVKDGGATGYSYILIGHRNGYASLYGHVSKILVKPGEIVGYGKVIGLSGGQPGTHGAGHMTTGSHVHLEMMKDGKHFDPRDVLPRR